MPSIGNYLVDPETVIQVNKVLQLICTFMKMLMSIHLQADEVKIFTSSC